MPAIQEGALAAPVRHPLGWRSESFYDGENLEREMARIFDICHGCRRCVSLCQAFPTLFDLVDSSPTLEIDGVDKKDFAKVVGHCYLCDLCFMTKCPYVPPHEWNVDFPHLMLRAKTVAFQNQKPNIAERMLASPQKIGRFIHFLRLEKIVNYLNERHFFRNLASKFLNLHPQAKLPKYERRKTSILPTTDFQKTAKNEHKVVIFTTCFGAYHDPKTVNDLVDVLRHNGVLVQVAEKTQCCGMPKMELGDLKTVIRYAEKNKQYLLPWVRQNYKIIAPVPSCVLMFKNELPLLLPDDAEIRAIKHAFFDPFEYLDYLHQKGVLKTDLEARKIRVVYHMACHQRVQNIGAKTKKILSLIPDISLTAIARCSGHDGTYGVKNATHTFAVKIARPVAQKLEPAPDYFLSDCMLAGHHIAEVAGGKINAIHPISLLKMCYQNIDGARN